MATLFLRRVGQTLVPAAEGGDENTFSKTWRELEVLRCEVKKPRNVALHRKAFILLQVVYPHTSYPSMEALRHAMTVGAGYVDTVINPVTGDTALIPRSWAFDKLDETAFRELYHALIGVALHIVAGSTREDWDLAVDEIAAL